MHSSIRPRSTIRALSALVLTAAASLGGVRAFGSFGVRPWGVSANHLAPARDRPRRSSTSSRRLRQGGARSAVEVWIEDAEDGFVDREENLEDGEVLVKAVKAFASDPDDPASKRFLSAGALVQRPPELTPGENKQNDALPVIYDAWVADAIMDGGSGGPNLQLRGVMQVLDDLFRDFLSLDGSDSCSERIFVVQCGSGDSQFTCASHRAAVARGFRSVDEIAWPDCAVAGAPNRDLGIDDGMIFDPLLGVGCYTSAALVDRETGTGLVSLEILGHLSARRMPFSFDGAVHSRGGPPMRCSGQIVHKPGFLPQHVARDVFDRVAAAERVGLLSDETDSVDLMPSLHLSLIANGRPVTGKDATSTEAQQQVSGIAGLIEPYINGVLPDVSRMTNTTVVVSDVFVRRYGEHVGAGESRLSIPAHYDVHSIATVVIALDSIASQGRNGLYTVVGGGGTSHAALRRFFPLQQGDAVLHSLDVIHGVDVKDADRTSLVIWFAEKEATVLSALPSDFASNTTDDASVRDFILGIKEEARTFDSGCGYSDIDDLAQEKAFEFYFRSASAGNPLAITRLASLCEMGSLSSNHVSSVQSLLVSLPNNSFLRSVLIEYHEASGMVSRSESRIVSQQLYLEGAVRGNPDAQIALADSLLEYCDYNMPEAFCFDVVRSMASILYALAAQQGDRSAEQSLMHMIREDNGHGGPDSQVGASQFERVRRAAFAAETESTLRT